MPIITVDPTTPTITPLCDRKLHRHCHIQVTDLEGRLPAIELAQEYYYFFKYFEDQDKAQIVATKLQTQGDRVIVSQIPLGFAVWVYEPDAQVVPKRPYQSQRSESEHSQADASTVTNEAGDSNGSGMIATTAALAISSGATEQDANTAEGVNFTHDQRFGSGKELVQILEPDEYSVHQIQVPDLDEYLDAIAVGGLYYSFFRTTGDMEDLISIGNKLARRGDDIKITRDSNRFTIWVLEPDATAITT